MKKEYIVELTEKEADELMNDHWVRELVRCKDCREAEDHKEEFQKHPFRCRWRCGFNDGNFFCARGDRKDG